MSENGSPDDHPAPTKSCDDEKGVVLTEGNVLYAKLKCILCGKCLSVEPVSESHGQYTCGRCRPNSNSSRLFAAIAQHLTFACIFNGCKEKLKWGEAKAHEKICDFRDVSCPFSQCMYRFPLSSFQSHVEDFHTLDKIRYCSDELNLESFIPFTPHVNLRCISYEGYTFLVFIRVFKEACCTGINGQCEHIKGNCSVGVFFIGSKPDLPNVTFQFAVDMGSNVDASKTIDCNNIKKYIDTKHCLDCLSKVCRKPDHENINTFLQGAFNFQNHSKLFSYVVRFTGTLCSKALPNFECPVCKIEFEFDDRIYLCPKGHSLCSGCRKRLDVCSFCRSPIKSDVRNFTLEQIIREHKHGSRSE